MIHISKDGTGDFESIGEALCSLPADHTPEHILYIHKGFYEEQITVTHPHLILIGEDPDNTILSHGLYARMIMENGMKRGTFRTYSCLIDTHDFTAKNLTFENSAGKGEDAGQAIALGQSSIPPGSMAGTIIKTAIWKGMLTLFSAAPRLIL